jgi:hypothetical protein
MKTFLTIFILVLLAGCGLVEKNSSSKWKTIEVGDYLFDFPEDFTLTPEQGIDSYVGKITGDSIAFFFDYGFYSNKLGETLEEYLSDGFWRLELSQRFMKDGITYDIITLPKVDVLDIRPANTQDSTLGGGCDYVAKCKHDDTVFEYPVYVPGEIKGTNYKIDTVDHLYRKIVWSKDPQKEITGIYIQELDTTNSEMSMLKALSMTTGNLTAKQQELSLRIFKTVRHKKKGEKSKQ